MKNYNNTSMAGRLHHYKLDVVSTKNGEAIGGTVYLETDAEGTVVPHRFFAYPTYKNGKPNRNYLILDDMMAGNILTVVDNGDDAAWYSIEGNIDVNYFKDKRSGELARAQKIRASFLNDNDNHKYNNKWKLDTLITGIQDVEADEERMLERFVRVTGFLADTYQERLAGVQFDARTEGAMNYIIGLEASANAPYMVSTWGALQNVSRSIVRKNAFGEDEVDQYDSLKWTITGMSPTPYDFGDESAMTQEEFDSYMAAHKAFLEETENAADEEDDVAF